MEFKRTVSPRERARQIQNGYAAIVLGPRLTPDGRTWRIPSPTWNEEAGNAWKALGGRFERGGFVPFWYVPREQADLRTLDTLYRRLYRLEIRDASMRLTMANHDLYRKVTAVVKRREGSTP